MGQAKAKEATKKESKAAIKKAQTINLQGKDYLQVQGRILMFRTDYPTGQIVTEFLTLGTSDDPVRVAKAAVVLDEKVVAIGHKSVQSGGRGPAAKFPLEMAETGAIGRALGLLGYGTLSGDFDEVAGDQIADAPVDPKRKW